MPRFFTAGLLIVLLSVTGCLPSSCKREEPRELFPADSLSRELAATLPVDTLDVLWTASGTEASPLAYPRTVRFASNGEVYVSDVERNSVFVFGQEGAFREEIAADAFAFPYLAGWRGDTLLVFNPTDLRIDWVVGGEVVAHTLLPQDLDESGRLTYATAFAHGFYFKGLRQDEEGYLAQIDDMGQEQARIALAGPTWRYAGLLKLWDNRLLSFSAYRPLVDVWQGGEAQLDSLRLTGFDSPMLARTRAFMLGVTDEAPLLSASAAATDSLLFVINMRPGWLHIDTFDRSGQVQHRLTQANPAFNTEFYPIDIAVRPAEAQGYHIAVAVVKPRPHVAVYTWKPSS